jgi:putative ABC transporter-associated repeat protein
MRGGRPGHRRMSGIAGAVALVLGAVLTVPTIATALQTAAQAAEPTPRRVVNDIHTDSLYVVFENGRLNLKTRVGNAPNVTFHDPSEVIFQLKDTADSRLQVPDIPEFGFLGEPGAPVWVAPEVEIPGLLWPGWATEDPSMRRGLFQGDAVNISLVDVSGPGRVEVFRSDPIGRPIRDFSSTDSRFKAVRQDVPIHTHTNWVFTALGHYTLTFEVTGTTTGGDRLSTGPVSFTWFIGGAAATDVTQAATSTALSVSPDAPRAADEVTMAAAVTPRAPGSVEFFDGATSLGRQQVRDGKATLTTSALAAGAHSLTAVYTSDHTNDYVTSTSPIFGYTVPGGSTTPTPTPTPTSSTPSPTPTSTVTPTSPPTTPPPTDPPLTNPPATRPAASAPTSSPPAGGSSGAGSGGGSSGGGGGSSGGNASEPKCVPATAPSGGSGGGDAGNGGGVAADAVVLDNGHVDYAARVTGGRLQSLIKDGSVAGRTTWREPSSVVFHLKPEARTTIPAGFGFLGGAGSAIWQVPQTQRQGILWLGWNTEEISTSQATGNVTWRLDKVTGPGKFAIYEFTTFGQPQVIFNSGDGVPDSASIRLGTHAHGNWAFTSEGVYKLTFTHSVRLTSGATSSDTEVVTFAVGDVNPATAGTASTSSGATTQSLRMRPVAYQESLKGRDSAGTVIAAGCRLPFTGAAVLVPAAAGAGLLALGAVIVGVTRRRRRSASAEK